jgi:hypothetical protein
MASTYSTNLKIELMALGDQSGTWGTTTNTNFGTSTGDPSGLEQAIVGYGNPDFTTDADLTITLDELQRYASGTEFCTQRHLLGLPHGHAEPDCPDDPEAISDLQQHFGLVRASWSRPLRARGLRCQRGRGFRFTWTAPTSFCSKILFRVS